MRMHPTQPHTTPASPTSRGLFVAFEGGEGAGKTTQITRLASALTARGREVCVTREPGGTPLGRRIREMLLNPATGSIDPRTEALLFAADRAEHVAALIRPALDDGQVVLTDRYMDSSAAYQGAGRGLLRHEVLNLSLWAAGGLVPDLTIVLDVDPRIGLSRATTSEFGAADRFESEALGFADSVRAGFLELAAKEPHRYLVLDAAASADDLHHQIVEALDMLAGTSAEGDGGGRSERASA